MPEWASNWAVCTASSASPVEVVALAAGWPGRSRRRAPGSSASAATGARLRLRPGHHAVTCSAMISASWWSMLHSRHADRHAVQLRRPGGDALHIKQLLG